MAVQRAPALKKADIGIAMSITGTDVTGSLYDAHRHFFASIVAAVEEGNGVFGNIKKYLMFLLSSNIGEIELMVALPCWVLGHRCRRCRSSMSILPPTACQPWRSPWTRLKDLMKRKPRDPHG